MQTSPLSGFQVTELTAINVAKVITIACLFALAAVFGIRNQRQVIYLCLHISYCLWWLLEQFLFPQRSQQIFTARIGAGTFLLVLLFTGVFYALPGYFAFSNLEPIGFTAVAVALPLYIFGSLINTAADVQMMTAKGLGAGLVKDGIWRNVRHTNYLGDLLRYTSLSVVAGSPWAFLLPATILLLYVQRIGHKEREMAVKYPDFAGYQQGSVRLVPWIW